jgi:hypothetical protein
MGRAARDQFLVWILVACFAFAIAALFCSSSFSLALGLCAGGLIGGCLLVQVSLKQGKALNWARARPQIAERIPSP